MSELVASSGVLYAVYLFALPLSSVYRRILIQTFPPRSHGVVVDSNVGEYSVLLSRSKRVEVRLSVGSGSYAKESVFGVDSVKSSVLTLLHPSDVVADSPNLVTLFGVASGRNEHCEVGLAASGGECSGDVLNFTVGLLYAEDKHMLSHPALVLALEGSDSQCEALLAEQYVSAVSRVDRPNSVLFGEVNDVSLFRVNVSLRVQTANEVVRSIAEVLESLFAHSGHDVHIEYNIDRVGQLYAYLSERRTDGAHGIRDNVHGSALHNAVIHGGQHCLHVSGSHPVVSRACVLFLFGADESSVLYAGYVVRQSSVIQTAGVLFLIELYHLARSDSLFSESVELLIAAIDPNYLVRLGESDHFVYPCVYVRVLCKTCHNFKNSSQKQ